MKLKSSNKMVDFASLLSTILGSQRTFLSMLRTVSIFAALALLVKTHWVLVIVLLLFLFSIYEFQRGYHKLEKLVNNFTIDEDETVIKNITNFNNTLYGYSFVLICIFIAIIINFEKSLK